MGKKRGIRRSMDGGEIIICRCRKSEEGNGIFHARIKFVKKRA